MEEILQGGHPFDITVACCWTNFADIATITVCHFFHKVTARYLCKQFVVTRKIVHESSNYSTIPVTLLYGRGTQFCNLWDLNKIKGRSHNPYLLRKQRNPRATWTWSGHGSHSRSKKFIWWAENQNSWHDTCWFETKEVAQLYRITLGTVKRIWCRQKLAATQNLTCKSGRKYELGPRCCIRLVNYIHENNKKPLFMIAVKFRTIRRKALSLSTIRRYLLTEMRKWKVYDLFRRSTIIFFIWPLENNSVA